MVKKYKPGYGQPLLLAFQHDVASVSVLSSKQPTNAKSSGKPQMWQRSWLGRCYYSCVDEDADAEWLLVTDDVTSAVTALLLLLLLFSPSSFRFRYCCITRHKHNQPVYY